MNNGISNHEKIGKGRLKVCFLKVSILSKRIRQFDFLCGLKAYLLAEAYI